MCSDKNFLELGMATVYGKLLVEENLSQFFKLKCPETVVGWFIQVQM